MAFSNFVPPFLLPHLRRMRANSTKYHGDFEGWEDAAAHASGYHNVAILDRVAHAVRAVQSGQAAFERDGVLFDQPEFPFNIIAGLLSAPCSSPPLSIVDFGGALGSLYRLCKPFFTVEHRWFVVEQDHFVKKGQEEFQTETIKFVSNINDISQPHAILAAGVLQYLSQPFDVLAEFAATGALRLVIDRIPLQTRFARDVFTVQKVPDHIYDAAYPCRIFNRQRLFDAISPSWTIVAETLSPEGGYVTQRGLSFEFRSFILDRAA